MSCDDAVDGDDYGRRDERGIKQSVKQKHRNGNKLGERGSERLMIA